MGRKSVRLWDRASVCLSAPRLGAALLALSSVVLSEPQSARHSVIQMVRMSVPQSARHSVIQMVRVSVPQSASESARLSATPSALR